MNYIFCGDLHCFNWSSYASLGEDSYLAHVRALLSERVVELDNDIQSRSSGKTTVVLLGDLLEEPYKRGKVSVSAQNCIITALNELKFRTGCDVAVIAGNHDLVSGGASWLSALGRGGSGCVDFLAVNKPLVLPSDHNIDGHPVVLVPYAPPRVIEEQLSGLDASAAPYIVCGHFAFAGTLMSSVGKREMRFDSETGIIANKLPKEHASNVYILGHCHTPGNFRIDEAVVCYPGLAIPYGFDHQHDGCLVYYTPGATFSSWPTRTPRFFGPVSLAELEALNLRKGDFVKVSLAVGDKHTIEMLNRRYDGVNLFPCYEAEEPEATTQARCAEAAALASSPGASGFEAVARAYIRYQIGRPGCCRFSEEELMLEFDEVCGGNKSC